VTGDPDGRGRGERGTALVTALVLLFAFTAGGVVWLARDVDRRVANRSAAQSIAFQAARTGAQQIEVGTLRGGSADDVSVDAAAANVQARRIASRLFDEYGVDGSVVAVTVVDRTVTVEVRLSDPVGDVVGVGSARAEAGS
jgi:Tfp pilus assembly protein PilX